LRGWTTVFINLIVLAFVTKSSETYSHEVMITWFIIALLGQMGHHPASHINSNK
jgi:hypothetical protein